MKVGVLTSSRADFGIYTPLLNAMGKNVDFTTEIIAFGTHLSREHGYTINEIRQTVNLTVHEIKTVVNDTDPASISKGYAQVVDTFSDFWSSNAFDLVLCLGDRYEMNAAVQAGIPFGVNFGHFHGGEQTLGAIDNVYRHQITLASKHHFTATDVFTERVRELVGTAEASLHSVGSLSLSDLKTTELFSREVFFSTFNIPAHPFILCTFHSETARWEESHQHCNAMIRLFESVLGKKHLVVGLPNADTQGSVYREALLNFAKGKQDQITLIESFGKKGYFSAMNECDFILGNSSSGIIEAASFGKWVINVGDRQKGRLQSGNIIDVPFEFEAMNEATMELIDHPKNFSGENHYVKEGTIENVITILKTIRNGEL